MAMPTKCRPGHRCRVFLLGMILFPLLLGGTDRAVAAGENQNPWSFVGFTRYRDALYLDKSRLTRSPDGKVLVSALIKPAPGSLFRSNIQREIPTYRKSLEHFQYLVLVMELSCPEERLRFLVIQFRDASDQVLHTTTDAQAPWKPIKPGALWKDLAGTVCPGP